MERLTTKRTRVNGVKHRYVTGAFKEEITHRLGEYEDTGMTPEEIEDMKRGHEKGALAQEREGRGTPSAVFCSNDGAISLPGKVLLEEGDQVVVAVLKKGERI